jgi:hypothetical protein
MSRDYWFAFGGGTAAANSGLSPTFITFMNDLGTGLPAPAITEIASKGLYLCQYGATQTIVFTLDGFTTGLVATDRFISGVFDPYDQFGVTLNAMGLAIGTTASSYGNTAIDPVDLFGLMKRNLEFNEGNKTYTKATGLLDYFIRGGAVLLREKTVSDSSTTTTTT